MNILNWNKNFPHSCGHPAYCRWHKLPGHGTIDWETLMPEFFRVPRLISIQTEADPKHDPFTIAELKASFDRLMTMV